MHKKYFAIPDVLVGFDTETTGLDVTCERAISYGFCLYEQGRLVWSDHFFVRPDRQISLGAQRVHGVSMEELDAKYLANEALSVPMGLIRAVGVLRDSVSKGALIVGANVRRFDLEMLRHSYSSVLQKNLLDDLHVRRFPVIDVIEHDEAIESRATSPRRRSLTNLCQHYGVAPGGHHAHGDARAAIEVFLAQVDHNERERRAQSPQIAFAFDYEPAARRGRGI